jgi:hypothetical protein
VKKSQNGSAGASSATTGATSATTRAKSAGTSVTSARTRKNRSSLSSQLVSKDKTIARLEATIAKMEGAFAELEARDEGRGASHETYNSPLAAHISLAAQETLGTRPSSLDPRVQLDVPVILSVTGTVSSFTLTWSAVTGAYSYTVAYSKDPSFMTGTQTSIVNAPQTTYTVTGREPETTYYVRVKSYPVLPGDDTASNYSTAQSIRTLSSNTGGTPGGDGDVVNWVQDWLHTLQSVTHDFAAEIPQLEDTELNSAERLRLLGSGVRRYGFIEKVFELSVDYPQFWPPFGKGQEELTEYVNEVDVFRNVLVWFRAASRVVHDLLLIAGDDAFRVAGAYYTLAREGARRKNPEAVVVYEMLKIFWKRSRRKSGDPTRKQVVTKVKALQNGTLEGELLVMNVNDMVIPGEKRVIDRTYRKGKGVRATEQGECRETENPE